MATDCKGRDIARIAGPGAYRPASGTFPNGRPIPANTRRDPWDRYITPAGVIGAEGEAVPYIMPTRGLQHGWVMNALLMQPSGDQMVTDYRSFLDQYSASDPVDVAAANVWLTQAKITQPTLTMAMLEADADQAQNNPRWSRSMHNV